MKTRKLIAMTAAACLAAASLAGCGSTQETTAATEAAATEAAETTAAAEGDTTYKIGICQLVQHEALDAATTGFKEALETLGAADGVTFIFDEQNAQGEAQTCSSIANQFANDSEIDLIMANATPALQACANATNTIPIIGTSVTSFPAALDIELNEDGSSGINVTGTNDLTPLADQAQQVKDLFPDAETVGIIYCSAEANSVYQADHISEAFIDLGIEPVKYSFADSNDLQSVVSMAATESDVIYIPTDNVAAANTSIIDAVCEEQETPVVAGEEGICRGCGIATISINFYDIGYRAGEMAYDILVNGVDAATIPIEDPVGLVYEYNPVIAERFGYEFGDDYVALELE